MPEAAAAEERAWELVRSAYAAREPLGTPARSRRPFVLALVAAVVVAAAALSPPGLAVLSSVREALTPGVQHARTTLVALPAPGRLLVNASDGSAWVVSDDGSKRRLGPYRDATWSPHGLFVAAVQGRQLVALEPDGTVRWTLTRASRPRLPSWNEPDGFRIAYLLDNTLRVVNGDGTGDRLLAAGVASVRPAWRPGPRHELAYVRRDGTLVVEAADSGTVRWSRRRPTSPTQLSWTGDGRRLLVVAPHRLRVYDARGRIVRSAQAPYDTRLVAAAFRPGSHAVVELRRGENASSAVLLGSDRTLFEGPGRISGLAWSPNGRWLLLAWRSADQWLFVRVVPARRTVLAFGAIATAFNPADRGPAGDPTLAGWCCSR
ncbi:MAG TPA: hypothetical protein VH416_04740 [Gaiellaceae bacterium]